MPSMSRLRTIHYLKRAGFLLLLLAIGTGLYFGVQTDAWRTILNSFSSIGSKSNEPVENQKGDSFDDQLNRSSVQQLILKATQLIDDLDSNTTDRLLRQQQKIQIAEKLIQRDDSTRAVNFGVATKLSALRTRELINFDNGLTSIESLEELRQFANRYLTSFDEDTLRQANLGQFVVMLLEDLMKSEDDGYSMAPEVINSFESISKKYDNDIIVAEEFFEFLKRIQIHAPNADRDKYLKVYGDVFGNSRVEKIKILAADVFNDLVESEFTLTNIYDVIESQRKSAIQKLRQQIKDVIDRGYISQFGYYKIFSAIKDVAKAGDYAVALELLELLDDIIRGKATLAKLAAECLPVKKRLRYVGQKFSFDGIKSTSGNPFSQRLKSAPLKAVLFSQGSDDLTAFNQYLFAITRAAGRDSAKGKFCISAVVCTSNDDNNVKSQIERTERLVPSVDFAILNLDTESGNQLFQDLALQNSILLMFLDDQDKVVAVGIEKTDIESTYKRLKQH